jgi:hypothetical protein
MALKAIKMSKEKGEEGPGARRDTAAPPEVVDDPDKPKQEQKAPTPGSPLSPADQPEKPAPTTPSGGGA